jgi:hypothetical protein
MHGRTERIEEYSILLPDDTYYPHPVCEEKVPHVEIPKSIPDPTRKISRIEQQPVYS